ncbi:putative adenylate-forming enzyme [Sphingomonas kyeonggiensis]|uniref:Putative adenylate-forming enzyme n=1 Tax=Sphingomonas kyeonggiensis TaxID=1268553 RepID=A0A7W7K6E4_9SPHN|nr:F390 synthetase-related protein [Sphingomonas kyeonggiensis]MBB4841260.1 putative adenylate-forming enzyme [Sphingomonas kyeonggiensis]
MSAVSAFVRTRRLTRRLTTPDDVRRWQAARLAGWMKAAVPRVDAFAGEPVRRLEELPVMDKAILTADFAAYNRPRITAEEVRAALDAGADRVRGHPIGQSTGTSGNRGYYVISEAERFVWLGTILAKALPDVLWRRHRVALALPGFSTLYRSAERGRRISLRFFDLALGVDAWADQLGAFAPDTIVAPPKVLRRLAESGRLTARNLFSGAEVLDPLDRAVIEAATGARVREIYMATEGLFGVACPHGTLHLAEDAVRFEWQPSGDSGLVTPLVTDFTRRTQIMARYRMNDLLVLSDERCACGSPLQAVARIEGRQDDVFELQDAGGQWRMITPDVLRNAVVDADRAITDFRIVQTAADRISVALDPALSPESDARVSASLAGLFDRAGVVRPEITVTRGLTVDFDRKLRRVRREWRQR